MPVDYRRYPTNWFTEIRPAILKRANNRCEWCGAENHKPNPVTGSMVVLTIMHLDHNPQNSDVANLKAACQKCHNVYDAPHRAETRKAKRKAKQQSEDSHVLD